MSDDDFLIDDMIYELATTGGGDKKRKKRASEGKSSSRKKARTDLGTSDMDESDAESRNPYPLEGKYKNEEDRRKLNDLPDLEREEILAQRQEEMQGLTDKLNLSRLFAAQTGGGSGSGMADDSVAMAAKRKRTMTGNAKEKAHTRDALKASRRAKEERRVNHHTGSRGRDGDDGSPSKTSRANRTYSDDDSDMEMGSDDESVHASPQRRKNFDEEKKDEEIKIVDLAKIQLTRTKLSKECMKPWFEEYVKGGWVRYLIGQRDGQPVYRICEVKGIGPHLVLPYTIESEQVNQQLELAFGKSARLFNMDKVSNGPFTEREFNRLVITCKEERVAIPTKSQVQNKLEGIKKLEDRTLTEADVSAIIARRRTLNPQAQSLQQRIAEGSRIRQELKAAQARGDKAEVTRIRADLDTYNANWGITDSGHGSGSDAETGSGKDSAKGILNRSNSPSLGGLGGLRPSGGLTRTASTGSAEGSVLEEISKRNRLHNQENARRIQMAEAERRRKAHLERLKAEEAKKKAESEDSKPWKTEADLAGKDMAHSVEIELPDF